MKHKLILLLGLFLLFSAFTSEKPKITVFMIFAERPQGKACHFQGLHTERDANNGEHHQ